MNKCLKDVDAVLKNMHQALKEAEEKNPVTQEIQPLKKNEFNV